MFEKQFWVNALLKTKRRRILVQVNTRVKDIFQEYWFNLLKILNSFLTIVIKNI